MKQQNTSVNKKAHSRNIQFLFVQRCRLFLSLKLLCLIACLSIYSSVFAQGLQLSGVVLDKQGGALEGVYLIVADPETAQVLSISASDSDGKYTLTSVPSRFVLNVTHIGYESVNLLIEDETGMKAAREIRMHAIATQLEDAVITADAPKIEREIGKFVMRNIAASPLAKGSNTYNFLRFMPMIDVKPEGGISILGKKDANILIDGRSVGSNKMAEQMLKGIPASEIARIEIIPVKGSAHSAENRNGIINIVLKRPDEGVRLTATLEDSQGYYNSPNGVLFMNYAGKRFDLTAGVTTSYNQLRQESDQAYDYLQTNSTTSSDFRESTRTLFGGGYLNMNYKISELHRLGAQISLGGQDYRQHSYSLTSYGKIGSSLIDSVYSADVKTNSPTANLNWSANLNYVFTMDNKGSNLSIDLDYRNNNSKRNIYSIYSRDYNTSSIVTEDFLQQPETKTRVYGGQADYVYCFDKDNKLKVGASAYHGKVDNNFFYGVRSGEDYISNNQKSNRFIYKDYNIAGYASFQRAWSDKFESEIGVRVEKYHAQGTQQTTSEKINRDEFDVFPSVSLLYMPSDDHELSLDFTSSVMRPYYGDLNPFITYTSPSTYIQNNPDLRSSKGYELMLSYTMFDDYMLTVDYLYDTDLWTEFILPVGNMTRTYLDNYGNSHALDISLLVSKRFFKNYWYISAEATLGYENTNGSVNDRKIDFDDLKYGVTVKSNLALSKKHSWYLDFKYQFSSKSRAAAYSRSATHGMEFYLLKQFRRASLSAGVYNILMPKVTVSNTFQDYGFSITNKRFVTGVITFSYTFGNMQTRRVDKRQNKNIEKRMQ